MDAKRQILQSATGCLRGVFAKHQRDGMLSIYIWGSITRDDFDPTSSDVDSIAVVDDFFPLDYNESIKDELSAALPGTEWGFQIIYLSELNGGPLISRVAKVMAPQTILSSFQDWLWVAGRQFDRADFSLPEATMAELMLLDIGTINRRLEGLKDLDAYRQQRNRKGLVKACLQLIYSRQQMRSGHFPLSYNRLQDRADDLERPILSSLLKAKEGKLYTKEYFAGIVPKVVAFRDKIEHELEP